MTDTTIQTFSGLRFDLLDPRPDRVRIADVAHSLARLNRYTGHAIHEHYSVAEHCVEVVRRVPGSLVWEALCHDRDEVYTGDWSKPLKLALEAVAPGARARLEGPIKAATAAALCCSVETPPEVKRAELGLYAIERAQVMAPVPDWALDQWVRSATSEPLPEVRWSRLACLSPNEAERLWLLCAYGFAPTPGLRAEVFQALDDLDRRIQRAENAERDE